MENDNLSDNRIIIQGNRGTRISLIQHTLAVTRSRDQGTPGMPRLVPIKFNQILRHMAP